MSAERPTYVVFNGATGSVTGDRALKAKVGDKLYIFFGVGGPNHTSSFHSDRRDLRPRGHVRFFRLDGARRRGA